MKKLFILLILSTYTLFFYAQQDIDAIEIVTLHTPIEVQKTGRSVTILSAEEISSLPVTSVEEALRFIPGLNINSRGGFGVQSDIGMRGSTFTQVLLLIDGIRWNDILTGHFNNTIPVPLSEIDRIEVIRGPASAIYGSDAVGGVIHIRTKTFAQTHTNNTSSAGRYYLGEHALNDGDMIVSHRSKSFIISGGYKHTSADGEVFRNPNYDSDFFQNPNFASLRPDSTYSNSFNIQSATIASSYQINDEISINARFAIDDRDFKAKYFYTTSLLDESIEETTIYTGQLSASRKTENNKQFLGLGYKQTDDLFAFNSAFTPNDHHVKQFTIVGNHQMKLVQDIDITLGFQSDIQSIESTDRGDHNSSMTEAFAVSTIPVNDHIHAMVSLRGGHNDNYGWTANPQASIAYMQDKYTLRASAGTATRTPDFTERFNGYLLFEPSEGRNIGNPELSKEQSTTVDIGIDGIILDNIKASLTGFYRSSDDLIDYVITPSNDIQNVPDLLPNTNYLFARNIASAQTIGIESQIETTNKISEQSSIRNVLGYTWLNTSIDDDIESKYLANHPNHQFTLTTDFAWKQFDLLLMNQYIRRQDETLPTVAGSIEKNYILTNTRISYKIDETFTLNTRINNLWDQEYQEILGSQMPGRWISAGFQWHINK